jgi:N-acetylneuraminic acid mutarotase
MAMERYTALFAVVILAGCSNAALQSRIQAAPGHASQPTSSVGVRPDANNTNWVSNAGFESPFPPGIVTCLGVPQSTGIWQPTAQPNGALPVRENTIRRHGSWALEVNTPSTAGDCGASFAYQDLALAPNGINFPGTTSYIFSTWVYPVLGEQQQTLNFGWNHGSGAPTTVGTTDVTLFPDHTTWDAWGQSANGPAVTYGSWHLISLTVDAVTLTSSLSVDNVVLGASPTGSSPPTSPVTLILGHEYNPFDANTFYWDDVFLDSTPHIKKITPATIHMGAKDKPITISGTTFSPGTTLTTSNPGVHIVPGTPKNSRVWVNLFSVDPSPSPGPVDVTVTSNGGSSTCKKCLTIISPWATESPMPLALAGVGASGLAGSVYVVGGYDSTNTPSNQVISWSPSNRWVNHRPMLEPRAFPGVATMGAFLYVIGGFNTTQGVLNTTERYDWHTNQWVNFPLLINARMGPGVGVINNKLYVLGGRNAGGSTNTMEVYDPGANMWTLKASMQTPRFNLGVGVINGQLYAVGGINESGRVAAVEAYNPSTDTWSPKAPLPVATADLGVGVINGTLYAIGGDTDTGTVNTVEAYDPTADAWYQATSMPTPRSSLGVAALKSTILAVGGINGPALTTTELFTP